ncbi:hypothetical protein VP01_1301g2 [Puccinia sorghi]|uniref:Uncharacterized protein n=1 Tax=Puccinia sorghi TaxID=27349 RepID=A0A0L6VN46_9BASI|nr:hypothetical protein VP01_1301g2 [Puccinia sorghi]
MLLGLTGDRTKRNPTWQDKQLPEGNSESDNSASWESFYFYFYFLYAYVLRIAYIIYVNIRDENLDLFKILIFYVLWNYELKQPIFQKLTCYLRTKPDYIFVQNYLLWILYIINLPNFYSCHSSDLIYSYIPRQADNDNSTFCPADQVSNTPHPPHSSSKQVSIWNIVWNTSSSPLPPNCVPQPCPPSLQVQHNSNLFAHSCSLPQPFITLLPFLSYSRSCSCFLVPVPVPRSCSCSCLCPGHLACVPVPYLSPVHVHCLGPLWILLGASLVAFFVVFWEIFHQFICLRFYDLLFNISYFIILIVVIWYCIHAQVPQVFFFKLFIALITGMKEKEKKRNNQHETGRRQETRGDKVRSHQTEEDGVSRRLWFEERWDVGGVETRNTGNRKVNTRESQVLFLSGFISKWRIGIILKEAEIPLD